VPSTGVTSQYYATVLLALAVAGGSLTKLAVAALTRRGDQAWPYIDKAVEQARDWH
jgi:hypothetical protein